MSTTLLCCYFKQLVFFGVSSHVESLVCYLVLRTCPTQHTIITIHLSTGLATPSGMLYSQVVIRFYLLSISTVKLVETCQHLHNFSFLSKVLLMIIVSFFPLSKCHENCGVKWRMQHQHKHVHCCSNFVGWLSNLLLSGSWFIYYRTFWSVKLKSRHWSAFHQVLYTTVFIYGSSYGLKNGQIYELIGIQSQAVQLTTCHHVDYLVQELPHPMRICPRTVELVDTSHYMPNMIFKCIHVWVCVYGWLNES